MAANSADAKYNFSYPLLGKNPALDNVIIAIGASTGGTEAVLEVLRMLPADAPCVVVVQHMPPERQFSAHYAERLDQLCKMKVREARHGDLVKRGSVYIAPADHHLRIAGFDGNYILLCDREQKQNGHRPSVDALFYSMAENVKCKMIGVIMTGMGDDGAKGLLAMHKNGAYTIGQNRESSAVYGMPYEAHKAGAVDIQAPVENIAGVIIQYLKQL